MIRLLLLQNLEEQNIKYLLKFMIIIITHMQFMLNYVFLSEKYSRKDGSKNVVCFFTANTQETPQKK